MRKIICSRFLPPAPSRGGDILRKNEKEAK